MANDPTRGTLVEDILNTEVARLRAENVELRQRLQLTEEVMERAHAADAALAANLQERDKRDLAMIEIMQAVAQMRGLICTCPGGSDFMHEQQGCPVMKARKLLSE